MQTVRDFVTRPITGLTVIDETPCAVPLFMVTGDEPPVAQLAFEPTIASVTDIPSPWRLLWRRPFTRLTR